jgi:hypothetical protein
MHEKPGEAGKNRRQTRGIQIESQRLKSSAEMKKRPNIRFSAAAAARTLG